MKKLLTILLTAILAFGLVACGGNDNTDGGLVSGSADTFGQNTIIEFRLALNENKDADAITLLTKMSESELFGEMSLMPMELDPTFMPGLNGNTIEGYESAAMMSPMIGVIPFVTYAFQLSEGTDANAFAENLKAIADPAWNICTSADEVLTYDEGNTVFFVMSPLSFE